MVKKKSAKKQYIVGTFLAEKVLLAEISIYDALCRVRNAFRLTDDELLSWKKDNPELARKTLDRTDTLVNILHNMKGWDLISVDKTIHPKSNYTYVTISFVEETFD